MSRTVRSIVSDMRAREVRRRAGAGATNGTDPRRMREHNRRVVLNRVREHGPITRVAIAQQTGLSRTTVSSIIEALLHEGLVREGDTLSATAAGGRRAILVHFNAAAGYILGVDMGRTHLTLLLTDLAAQIVGRRSGPFRIDQGPDAGLAQLVLELNGFLAEQGGDWSQVVGIGLGISAPLDASVQQLVSPPGMPGWNGVDVRRALKQQLGVPIYVDNDANMGALGESRYGAGRGISDLAYIKIGTGIGGALVIGGQVYRGSRGSAGEIGHMTMDEQGPLCACGNRGCLEAVASADAIVADALAESASRRLAPPSDAVPDPPGPPGAPAHLDIAEVVRAAQWGDPASQAALERAGKHVGVALAGLVNLTNPSLILVDGGVARAGDRLLDPIRRAVAARSLAVASQHVRIAVGELRENAIAFGGVAMVTDAAFEVSGALSTRQTAPTTGMPTDAPRLSETGASQKSVPGPRTARAARDPPAADRIGRPP
ncbi:MAG TPA: ROK family transcriptional regulator [Ktedonobacterales bacterium]|nr:ROK family transcriptional regulator [Ktedonobacterales bacterium]